MKINNMNIKFNVREYVESFYGEDVLKWYEEDMGINGLEFLWGCGSKKEVDSILEGYCV